MTRADVLKAIAVAHEKWSLAHGDDVPYVAADEAPHDGETTDLSLWQADRSAPPEVDDPLNAEIKSLLAQLDDGPVVASRELWAGCRWCLAPKHTGPCR